MLSDKYISDAELDNIKKVYCDKIVLFKQFRKEIKKWYADFDFQYPHSSENNYRDSWFHYRKIYQEHSAYESVRQIANFEEHLQRAEKDAIIFFWQKICEILEFWYFLDKDTKISILSRKEQNVILNRCKSEDGLLLPEWVFILEDHFGKDVSKFKYACIYVVQNYILSEQFRKDTQNLLHEIKNVVLNMRMDGAEIQREDCPGSYLTFCKGIYAQMQDFCKKYSFKDIIGITEIFDSFL